MTRRWLFDPAMRVGQAVRPLLPAALRAKVPARREPGPLPARRHRRKVLLPPGCVQPAMMPRIDAATVRVLDALQIESVTAPGSGCCGALRYHLNDHDGGLADARRNIDAWWPGIERGDVEAIVVNASGCGAMIKDYGHLLREDPHYHDKAARVSGLTRDLAEFLPAHADALRARMPPAAGQPPRVVFHPPCTLQHGQQVRGAVEGLLASLGVPVLPVADAHLCCGSAGTYSVLQPQLSQQLRGRKLMQLQQHGPAMILSANIGCLAHLQSGTDTPVRHWIEWLDDALAPRT
jgi:glycolate oxidase iron-sulfur subunit